ncbi:hypothetical protein JXB11_04430 [Candidatus Woesearchaeota archaeon]|nr:hypothetical protein [Candidatus Woesearchaeota archaeon]
MIFEKSDIRPTGHYLLHHSDVEWELVTAAIISPTKTHPNRRRGKDRFTYIREFKKFSVEVHTKEDDSSCIIWVINAFKMRM